MEYLSHKTTNKNLNQKLFKREIGEEYRVQVADKNNFFHTLDCQIAGTMFNAPINQLVISNVFQINK